MAAVVASTAGEYVTLATGSNPAAVNITVPSDATAVYVLWAGWAGASGHGVTSVTLDGDAADESHPRNSTTADDCATGVFAWYGGKTGVLALDFAFANAHAEGPVCCAVYVKDGDVTAWRDADANATTGSTACAVTLTTVSGDLVIALDQKFNATPPALISGWTSIATGTTNSESGRSEYFAATGSTTVADCQGEDYSSIVAIAVKPAAAGGATSFPFRPAGRLISNLICQ